MWSKSFKDEIVKNADLINKGLFKQLSLYDQQKMVEARDTIATATAKDSKIPQHIREKMIAAAFESLKNMSWDLARVGKEDKLEAATCSSVGKPKKKYVL